MTDMKTIFSLLLGSLVFSSFVSVEAQQSEPFKLNAEENANRPAANYSAYPAYPAYPSYPAAKPQPAVKPPQKKLNASASSQQNSPPKLLQAGAVMQVALPAEFLGTWQVMGARQKIEALPQYQQGASNIFAQTTTNVWQIQGDPQRGYVLSTDMGSSTQLIVDKVQGNTAFIRYQHPVGNTMAQEAIVMQLGAGNASFTGLERISIVKQGEPAPRAKVTYQLIGRRQ